MPLPVQCRLAFAVLYLPKEKIVRYCQVHNDNRPVIAMFDRISTKYFLMAATLLLAATSMMSNKIVPANTPASRQVVAEWSGEQLSFVADSRMGRVQSFRPGRNGREFFAQTDIAVRRWVNDVKIDPQTAQLWVAGDDGISVYDARTLVLQKHIVVTAQAVATLRLEDDRIVLLAANGSTVGFIDRVGLLAQLPPARKA